MDDYKKFAEILLNEVRFGSPEDREKAIENVALAFSEWNDDVSIRFARSFEKFKIHLKKMEEDCFLPTASKEACAEICRLIGQDAHKVRKE